jgi:hypothetical protein
MRRYLVILTCLLLTSCGVTTDSTLGKINAAALSTLAIPIQTRPSYAISANILASDCQIKDESFTTLSSLRLSTLLQIDSAINTDLNRDQLKDNILVVRPTAELTELCTTNGGNINADYKLIADISGYANPIITDLGLEYVSGAEVSAVPNGFIFSNEIGQSIKCEEEAVFKIDAKDIYLDKVRTICLVPDSDIDWQERDLEKSAATLLQNVDLASAFDGLREVFFE